MYTLGGGGLGTLYASPRKSTFVYDYVLVKRSMRGVDCYYSTRRRCMLMLIIFTFFEKINIFEYALEEGVIQKRTLYTLS